VLVAGLGQRDLALLFVELEIFLDQARDKAIDFLVELGIVFGRAGNDQRRARFVDQDGVDFVDDREMMAALHHGIAAATSRSKPGRRSGRFRRRRRRTDGPDFARVRRRRRASDDQVRVLAIRQHR